MNDAFTFYSTYWPENERMNKKKTTQRIEAVAVVCVFNIREQQTYTNTHANHHTQTHYRMQYTRHPLAFMSQKL